MIYPLTILSILIFIIMKTIFNHVIYFLLMILTAFGTVSCEKFVETDFPNNQLATEMIFEDEKTADAALAGLYSALWNGMGS